MNLRDPIIYRILHESHHNTGDKWCIYPMYDFAHGIEDSIEGITHSICTLEFEDHRPLYDWFLDQLEVYHPQQIEFARLNLNYTVMSKRKFIKLVQDGHVRGWDDPRMVTISGIRRRGYTPSSIRRFAERVGVAKNNSVIDMALLEHTIRDELNETAPRVMAVLRPLKVIIDNYPEGKTEDFEVQDFPHDDTRNEVRSVPFSREIFIEEDDFMEEPPRKFFRLAPGQEVRLMGAYYITCQDVVKDAEGRVVELHCTYDPESRGGTTPDGRKVRGTLHWVSAAHGLPAEVRLYDKLFLVENPNDVPDGQDFTMHLNPNSLDVLTGCLVEPGLAKASLDDRFQFIRHGYFCLDSGDSRPDALVFNRTVPLRDTWAKIQQ
jgi:glutaminyl-tRNA synthetase